MLKNFLRLEWRKKPNRAGQLCESILRTFMCLFKQTKLRKAKLRYLTINEQENTTKKNEFQTVKEGSEKKTEKKGHELNWVF